MRKFKVNCIQISGKGRLLFNYGQEATEAQLNNPDLLLHEGAIIEMVEPKIIIPEKEMIIETPKPKLQSQTKKTKK